MTKGDLVGMQLSRMSAGHWIGAASRSLGSAPCFISGDGTERSFTEVNGRVNRLCRAFSGIGLRRGDRVAIVATDSAEHVEVVLACLMGGFVFCDLNFRLRTSELSNVVRAANAVAIVFEPRYEAAVDEITESIPAPPLRIELGGEGIRSIDNLIDAERDASPVDVAAHGEDIVSIAFTSGTTGAPKGVLHSERMIRSMVYSCISEARVRPLARRYNGPPLFHFAGIGSALYGVAAGATTLLLPQFEAADVLWWMQHGELNDCLLVPTMLSALLDEPNVDESTYEHLNKILYGGAPMTIPLLRRVMDTFNCDLFNLFGAGTEAGGQATLYPEDHRAALRGDERLLESVGRVIPGVEVRLVDDNLNDVQRGLPGELLVRTETSMSGYLNDPDRTASAVVDGWIRTGDVASIDERGYLFLASRRSEIIIRGGENIYPSEIEAVLSEHPDVSAAVVVGEPDEHWGEAVVALVVLASKDLALDQSGLVEHCRRALASYKIPGRFAVVPALPLNATGKVSRMEARRLASVAES